MIMIVIIKVLVRVIVVNQIKSNQIKSNQIKSNQIKLLSPAKKQKIKENCCPRSNDMNKAGYTAIQSQTVGQEK